MMKTANKKRCVGFQNVSFDRVVRFSTEACYAKRIRDLGLNEKAKIWDMVYTFFAIADRYIMDQGDKERCQ
jgi:hypothetical protein